MIDNMHVYNLYNVKFERGISYLVRDPPWLHGLITD